jgi:hypothetical protein
MNTKRYSSYDRGVTELLTREQALYEEFESYARSQCISEMQAQDEYYNDADTARELDRNIEFRLVA